MTYAIGQPCVDVMDRARVDERPAGATCYDDDLPEHPSPYLADNEACFTEVFPGRDEPLGSPGGAAEVCPLGVDTPLVAAQPAGETKGA
jgi:hypothetical protein